MAIFAIEIDFHVNFPHGLGKNARLVGYIIPYNLWWKVPSVCPKLTCPLGNVVVIITFKMGIFSLLKAVSGGDYTIYMAIISLDSDFISVENDYIWLHDSYLHTWEVWKYPCSANGTRKCWMFSEKYDKIYLKQWLTFHFKFFMLQFIDVFLSN